MKVINICSADQDKEMKENGKTYTCCKFETTPLKAYVSES